MVVVVMMKKNHEQFVELLQHFVVEIVEQIVVKPLFMKKKGI